MCGIAGFWQPAGFSGETARAVAVSMADRIVHRGPDDSGVWVDVESAVAMAHRRLAILDLSPAGHQPMTSRSGRFVLVFNGEIYNHLELRRMLEEGEPRPWRGHSDTETLLAGCEAWGIAKTLKKAVGMFALALWDREEQTLTLARDRIGEKPLYYGFQGKTLLFASELKSLAAHPHFLGEIDRDVLCLYVRHCYIPAPHAIYRGIRKLLPGTFIQFRMGLPLAEIGSATPTAYWSFTDSAKRGVANPFEGDEVEAVATLDRELRKAVALQMVSDVPLGAFLSGGVDSSSVVALMQAQSARPVKTFSIGFHEQGYNEAQYAKAVARHLGTEHTEQYVTSAEAREVIPQLGTMYDEPFADASQIPTFLVSRMARRHVTVSLSGDAGDELFCGYNRYLLTEPWGRVARVPFAFRRCAGRMIRAVPPACWRGLLERAERVLPLPANAAEKLDKLASRLQRVNGTDDLYYSLVSETDNPEELVLGGREPGTWLTEQGLKDHFQDPKLQMMHMDGMTYLPDDILVKVDRAAMFNSLESRVPFLDHRIVELAWSLPLSMKYRNGQSKWILRQVLYQYVPKELIERPKMGFGVPLADWMRGPLRPWVEELLGESRLRQEGFFDAGIIRRRWEDHLLGRRNWQYFLWSLLMFQEWRQAATRLNARRHS